MKNNEIRLRIATKIALKYLLEQRYLVLDDMVATSLIKEPSKEKNTYPTSCQYQKHLKES